MKDDMISRQAALNSPVKMVSDGLEWVPVYHLRELPSAQPGWIPTSERLPEGIGQAIVQTNGGAIHEVFYKGKNDYGHEVWMRLDGDIYWDDEVVAWMPLPTPYREGGHDNGSDRH